MKIALVSGSSREGSQSSRICQILNEKFFSGEASVLDLHEIALPEWTGKGFGDPAVKQVRVQLQEADAIVFVVPEWNGMAPAAIKNLFLWCSHKQLAHKPALLVAVSAGDGGAFVISEMRSSSYKNSRLLYLPEHVILRDVESLWAEQGEVKLELERRQNYLMGRLQYGLTMLEAYAGALVPVRELMVPQLDVFSNGMS
jgi:azobenzene reductase